MYTNLKFRKLLFLIPSLLIVGIGIYGAHRQHMLSKSPVKVLAAGNHFVLKKLIAIPAESLPKLTKGDTIISIGNETLHNPLVIKKIADTKRARTQIPISFLKKGKIVTTQVILNSKYENYFIKLNIITALMFYIIAIFVFMTKPDFMPARVFSWTCVLVSATLLIFWRNYTYFKQPMEYFLIFVYLLIYSILPGFILYFASCYPYKSKFLNKGYRSVFIIFGPGIIAAILLEVKYFTFIKTNTLNDFATYLNMYNLFRTYFIIYLLLTFFCLVKSYHEATTFNDKKKMQWILWAFTLGISPFLFLWTLFLALGIRPVYTEFVNYPFMLIIPVGIAISIVKYKALDIEVVINKSIVYVFLTSLILFTYIVITFIVSFITGAARPGPNNIVTILFTLIAALSLLPLRGKVQNFVDKIFYRVKYNYGVMREDFSNMLAQECNTDGLIDFTLQKIQSLFQIDKIMLMLPNPITSHLSIARQIGFSPREIKFIDIDTTGRASPGKTGVYLTIPVILDNSLIGLLLLGKKMSEQSYTEKETNLILPFIRDGLIALDRLRLRQAMIVEHSENKRLQEINTLKSEFIDHISHELRTPIAAVNWSVSNLLKGIPEKPSPKVMKYLIGVKESIVTLKSMIEDLLDITKIEAGKVEIAPSALNLYNCANSVVQILSSALSVNGINVNIDIEESIKIKADKTSLYRILTNLIDNGIKFSDCLTPINISAKKTKNSKILISVTNHGNAIPLDKIDSIFDKFSQITDKQQIKQEGMGLGLYITRKLLELHGSSINVCSNKNITTFSFTLLEAD